MTTLQSTYNSIDAHFKATDVQQIPQKQSFLINQYIVCSFVNTTQW